MQKNLSLILLMVLLSSFQQNWITKRIQSVDEINSEITFIKNVEKQHEDGKENIKLFMDNSASLIQYTQDFEEYYSFTKSYYKKDNIIIAEITYGLIPILYKKIRKDGEPLGYVLHEVKYFKNVKTVLKRFLPSSSNLLETAIRASLRIKCVATNTIISVRTT